MTLAGLVGLVVIFAITFAVCVWMFVRPIVSHMSDPFWSFVLALLLAAMLMYLAFWSFEVSLVGFYVEP